MKLLFDESLSPKLVLLLRDLLPGSESALRNGFARTGDRKILDYAVAHDFVLVSTDSDFERLLRQSPAPRSSFYVPAIIQLMLRPEVLRRNAIRIAGLPGSQDQLIILDR
jgi:predicted nuclease of predicted toxin-antitoxin system